MTELLQDFSLSYQYPVHFTRDLFGQANPLFRNFLQAAGGEGERKLFFILDEGVANGHPGLQESIAAYCASLPGIRTAGLEVLPGGEALKNELSYFFRTVDFLHDAGIDRQSYVVAIGGGSLLDLAGFAASVTHRGLRHLRIPTTVLSQNDSGVGVKNGINYRGKKNFLGAFDPPAAVFCDTQLLSSLSVRDRRSGLSEAVKVALVRDASFFQWLEENAAHLEAGKEDVMEAQIRWSARLHMEHIGGAGDPFERGSSRPLDFGHWSAHKLEGMSDFLVRHGEAVATGIALDSTYSCLSGWLAEDALVRILRLLQALRLPLTHPLLLSEADTLVGGLEEFREHLGGRLTIMLLRGIGQGEEVHSLDAGRIREALHWLDRFEARA